MPRLLAFIPADRVIVAKDDDSVSLITVTHGINVAIPETIFGKDVLLPHEWAVYSLWYKAEGDDGLVFQQRVEYISPRQKVLLVQDTQFALAKLTHSQISRVNVLPLESPAPGPTVYTLRLSLRVAGSEEFKTVAEYPLHVVLSAASVPVAQ